MKFKFTYKEIIFIYVVYVVISFMCGYMYRDYTYNKEFEEEPDLTEHIVCMCDTCVEERSNENEDMIEDDVTEEVESNIINLGEFKLTAYCSCSKCCGKLAYNRPKDENGNDIVYGSIGERLIAGISIAVDPNVIPYESEVVINGNTYIAQDTGGAINGNRIDVYFDDHQEAREFGVQYAEVFLIKNK